MTHGGSSSKEQVSSMIMNLLKITKNHDGNTWNPLVTNVTLGLKGVYFSDNDHGLVFGEGGVLLQTITGGVVALDEPVSKNRKELFYVLSRPCIRHS